MTACPLTSAVCGGVKMKGSLIWTWFIRPHDEAWAGIRSAVAEQPAGLKILYYNLGIHLWFVVTQCSSKGFNVKMTVCSRRQVLPYFEDFCIQHHACPLRGWDRLPAKSWIWLESSTQPSFSCPGIFYKWNWLISVLRDPSDNMAKGQNKSFCVPVCV